MLSTHSEFGRRVEEIECYFAALKALEEKSPRSLNEPYFNNEFVKTLKANTIIIIYNLVESTVTGALTEIYGKIKEDKLTYSDVNAKIQQIWFSFKFRQVYDQHSHYISYKDQALKIIESLLNKEVIELDRKATSISGNLDAQKIRNICREHGISFVPPRKSQGGKQLERVKSLRNELAHGSLSFAECGRDLTYQDLIQIKNETIYFLKGFLEGIKTYYDEEKYRSTYPE